MDQLTTNKQSSTNMNSKNNTDMISDLNSSDILALINQSKLGILVTDQSTNQLYVNEQAAKILGYTTDELCKIPLVDLIPHKELKNVATRSLAGLAGKLPTDVHESALLHKNGKSIPILVSSIITKWKGQSIRIASFSDVSKVKDLEFFNSEYHQLINNKTYIIVKIDTDGNILFINNSLCKFFNKTKSELIGKSFDLLIHAEDQKHTNTILKIPNTNFSSKVKQQRCITDKGTKLIEWVYTPIFDKNNNIIYYTVIGLDISKQHAIKQSIIKSDDKYRDLFNKQLTPYSTFDMNGNVLDYNDAFSEVYGFDTEKNYKGTNLIKFWKNLDERENYRKILFKNGHVTNYPVKTKNLKNNVTDILLNSLLIKDKQGNPIRIESTFIDNTKQLKKHKEVLQDKTLLKIMIDNRTKELYNTNTILENQNIDLKKIQTLNKTQNKQLKQKNIALNEMMSQLSTEKENMGEKVNANIENLVFPLLSKLKSLTTDDNLNIIELIEYNLNNIITTFGLKLINITNKLSPREIEICNLIKTGLRTKEISQMLNISEVTVVSHRNRIRRKLNIQNTKTNLTTYLTSL